MARTTTTKTPPPPRVAGTSAPPPPPPPPPKKTTTPPRRPVGTAKLRDNIAQQVTAAGMVLGTLDPIGGFVLISNADPLAETWTAVAEVNPRVRRVLEGMFTSGVYATAGVATMAVALPLLTHYRVLPRAWFNPATGIIEAMEEQMNNGAGLEDFLRAHEEAKHKTRNGEPPFVDSFATPDPPTNGTP